VGVLVGLGCSGFGVEKRGKIITFPGNEEMHSVIESSAEKKYLFKSH